MIDKNTLMEPQLSENAKYIAETRYAMKNEEGQTIEKVKDIFFRVAEAVAKIDENPEEQTRRFYEMMAEQKFMPNTPCLGECR